MSGLVANGRQVNFQSPKKGGTSAHSNVVATDLTNKRWIDSLRQSSELPSRSVNMTRDSSPTRKSMKSGRIEDRYIKNLQQQVHYLEMEANHLRKQNDKAAELGPRMSAEAQGMIQRLEHMQREMEGLELQNKTKEMALNLSSMEKERAVAKLVAAEEANQRERRLLFDEMIEVKRQKEILDGALLGKNLEIAELHQHFDNSASASRLMESKIMRLEMEAAKRSEQLRQLQDVVDDKMRQLMKVEGELFKMQEKQKNSSFMINHDNETKEDEIRLMRQKLKEIELVSSNDKYQVIKASDQKSRVVEENSVLSQQILELQKQLNMERSLRQSDEKRRNHEIAEVVTLRENDEKLKSDLAQSKEQMNSIQERTRVYLEQLSRHERQSQSHQLTANKLQNQLTESTDLNRMLEAENARLKLDRTVMIDHVTDLQKQTDEKDVAISKIRDQSFLLAEKVKQLEQIQDLSSTIHNQKWEEFGRLADSMKTLSRSMARSSASPVAWNHQNTDYFH